MNAAFVRVRACYWWVVWGSAGVLMCLCGESCGALCIPGVSWIFCEFQLLFLSQFLVLCTSEVTSFSEDGTNTRHAMLVVQSSKLAVRTRFPSDVF